MCGCNVHSEKLQADLRLEFGSLMVTHSLAFLLYTKVLEVSGLGVGEA